jgi:hypothetical protein
MAEADKPNSGTGLTVVSSSVNAKPEIAHLFYQDKEKKLAWATSDDALDSWKEPHLVKSQSTALPATPLAAVQGTYLDATSTSREWISLFYLSKDSEVQELYYDGKAKVWNSQDVKILDKEAATVVAAGSAIAAAIVDPSKNSVRIVFQLATDQQLKSYKRDGPPHLSGDTWDKGRVIPDAPTSGTRLALASWQDGSSLNLRIYYQGAPGFVESTLQNIAGSTGTAEAWGNGSVQNPFDDLIKGKLLSGLTTVVTPGGGEKGWLQVYAAQGGKLIQAVNEAKDKWDVKVVDGIQLIPRARLSAISFLESGKVNTFLYGQVAGNANLMTLSAKGDFKITAKSAVFAS